MISFKYDDNKINLVFKIITFIVKIDFLIYIIK